jgi:GNAT superfamily N-acetyltransferase
MAAPQWSTKVRVRPLLEGDLPEADRIVRLAFGTFMGLPDPSRFMGDAGYVYTRWKLDPSSAVAADHQGKVVGTNFATNWGSFGFFGPLTIEPSYWDRGVAQQLLAATMEIFRRWENRHTGLYTFAQSPKHMRLYQKFGYWPRDLVAVMAKNVAPVAKESDPESPFTATPALFSQASPASRPQLLLACREVTSANFEGLDLEREIRSVAEQKLGDTILLWDHSELSALAVCHAGPGTEAGTGVCYAKFAAVDPGRNAAANFGRLLGAIESYAVSVGAQKLEAGVNLARREAFSGLYSRGFRTQMQGVAMEAGDAGSGYNRAGVYILDDWR